MSLLESLIRNRSAETPGMSFGAEEGGSSDFDAASVVIIPVPYDLTVSWQKGAALGPEAIIEASQHLEFYDIETKSVVAEKGIYTLAPLFTESVPEVLAGKMQQLVGECFSAGKMPVVLGGDHSVSIGAAQAAAESHSELSVLQLDAHADTRDSYLGSRYNHACVMARVSEFANTVQVGIRSAAAIEAEGLEQKSVFYAHDIQQASNDALWQEQAVSELLEEVYVTIDVDCLDSSVMPSTGTPEPGGLSWWQVMSFLRQVAQQRKVVGFDVVELLPRECAPGCDLLAAKLVYQFLSYIFSKH